MLIHDAVNHKNNNNLNEDGTNGLNAYVKPFAFHFSHARHPCLCVNCSHAHSTQTCATQRNVYLFGHPLPSDPHPTPTFSCSGSSAFSLLLFVYVRLSHGLHLSFIQMMYTFRIYWLLMSVPVSLRRSTITLNEDEIRHSYILSGGLCESASVSACDDFSTNHYYELAAHMLTLTHYVA